MPEQQDNAAVEAVNLYLSKLGQDMGTGRFVLLIEAIGIESGERCVCQSAAKDQTVWDTLGLIDYARASEVAQLTALRVNGD